MSSQSGDATASVAEATPLGVISASEHSVEVVSDSGEGAQKCGQFFGSVSAKMGNGVWTVEIIPAEIQPPARTPASASGVRIRIGTEAVTNWGDHADLVIAFNEQVLLARHRAGALARGAIVLIESMWAQHDDERIREEWRTAMEELAVGEYRIVMIPMEDLCLEIVDNARRGKNMFALGLLAWIYDRDLDRIRAQIEHGFRKKSAKIRENNIALVEHGHAWGKEHLGFRVEIETNAATTDQVVMNGNQAIGMGAIAAGIDFCAMYPITPATSVSHYLAEVFDQVGGTLHQAEDEIAAIGAAIGASYAGKTALTVTSGPGLALKTEFIGLAVMAEIPLVIVNVQRGGPSTGQPTKVEQADLLAAMFGQPGDAPKVVLAPATIEDCFHCMVTARRIAETFRTVVIVLTDANLATGVQPFTRPALDVAWQASQPDQSAVAPGTLPFSWDDRTGLSRRIVPGRPDGMHILTGLIHDETGRASYASGVNQRSTAARSRKLAVLQHTLEPPKVHGAESGRILIVGWGSTKGAIEEAVGRAQANGLAASSLHLTFLSPLEPGLGDIFKRFDQVITVEINYSDDPDDPFITDETRRRGQLCFLLRAQTLVDVDCWTRVPGEPLRPGRILTMIEGRLAAVEDDR